VNGVHRLAASLACGIEPIYEHVTDPECNFNFKYFSSFRSQRGSFGRSLLVKMLYRNINIWSSNWRVGLILPKAMNADQGRFVIETIQQNAPIYWVERALFPAEFLKYLLLNCYPEAKWIGLGTGTEGLARKFKEVVSNDNMLQPIGIIITSTNDIEHLRPLKKVIRDRYGIGCSSIHISEERYDSISLAKAYCSSVGDLTFLKRLDYNAPMLQRVQRQGRVDFENTERKEYDRILLGPDVLEMFDEQTANDLDYRETASSKSKLETFSHNKYHVFDGRTVEDLEDDIEAKFSLFGISVGRPEQVIR
jgi:hypothetical protein